MAAFIQDCGDSGFGELLNAKYCSPSLLWCNTLNPISWETVSAVNT